MEGRDGGRVGNRFIRRMKERCNGYVANSTNYTGNLMYGKTLSVGRKLTNSY